MKKFVVLLVIACLAIGGVIFFFLYRMGTNDAQALADFPAAYNTYDQAISAYKAAALGTAPGSTPNPDEFAQKADEALGGLKAKAAVRISSLTRNDGELMKVAAEIADLAGKELAALKAYQGAVVSKSADADLFAKQFRDLTSQRQADFGRYLELAGIKNGPS